MKATTLGIVLVVGAAASAAERHFDPPPEAPAGRDAGEASEVAVDLASEPLGVSPPAPLDSPSGRFQRVWPGVPQ